MSKRQRKKTSHGGRPKQQGDRYDCGKLKPPGPNAVVLAERRRRLNDPTATVGECKKADDPLELFLARGWLSVDLFSAGRWYLQLHKQAGVSLPKVGVMDPNAGAKGYDHSEGDPEATKALRAIWARLAGQPGVAAILSDAVLHGRFPSWAEFWFANPPEPENEERHTWGFGADTDYPDTRMPDHMERERAALLRALRIVRAEQVSRRPARKPHPFGVVENLAVEADPTVSATHAAPSPSEPVQRGPVREVAVLYVDEEGGPAPIMSGGRAVEVVRRVRA